MTSAITFKLESIEYITNATWHDTCCCTHKGDISYVPTQNEIFDELVVKSSSRDKLSVITCAMGSTAGQSSITGSDSCEGGPAVFVDAGHIKDYNMPSLLAHETGHWLGLGHTFAKSCTDGGYDCPVCDATKNTGDGITDTPTHKKTSSCTTGID